MSSTLHNYQLRHYSQVMINSSYCSCTSVADDVHEAFGTFEEAERAIVDRVFSLGDMRASALMTPRTQVDWIDLEDDEEERRLSFISF